MMKIWGTFMPWIRDILAAHNYWLQHDPVTHGNVFQVTLLHSSKYSRMKSGRKVSGYLCVSAYPNGHYLALSKDELISQRGFDCSCMVYRVIQLLDCSPGARWEGMIWDFESQNSINQIWQRPLWLPKAHTPPHHWTVTWRPNSVS